MDFSKNFRRKRIFRFFVFSIKMASKNNRKKMHFFWQNWYISWFNWGGSICKSLCVKTDFLVGDSLEWEKGELPVNSVLVHTIQLWLRKMTPHLPYFCLNFSKYTFFVFRSFFDEKRPLIFRFSRKLNCREISMPYMYM